MKKPIILISALFMFMSLSSLLCNAQEVKPIQFGVRGGLNLSNLYASDASSSDMIVGFNLGVFNKIPVSSFLAIQPEFYVTTKGASVTYNNLFVDGTAKFNLTYLEVPVLCVANVTRMLNVQFGPYVAYLVDGKVKNVANVTLFNFEQNINVNDYNRIDAGLVLGAGLEIGSITMGARYNLGMTKVGKTKSFLGSEYTVPNANNGVINFNLAVSFNK
ncbi:MAG: porin family protein [Paludibacter sp.]|nr:porin family protein [Paludibacter sp.]